MTAREAWLRAVAIRWLRPRAAPAALGALAPVVIALFVGGVVLWATGSDPVTIYALLAREAFGGPDRIMDTLAAATPLLFAGLATAVAFRGGVFTLGVEGSFVFGGLAAAVVGAHVAGLPGPVAITVTLLAAVAGGLAVAVVPAVLRARWAVDEVVTTLMFNFVVTGLTGWLVVSFLQVRGEANSATAFIAENARLPRLAPPSELDAGLIIALVLVAAYAPWVRWASRGYELRMVGANPRFAAAHGIDVGRVVLIAMLAAGAIGGLGGGAHALGTVHRFVAGFSPGYGFAGLAIALLGRHSAAGVALCAVLFGALASAGATVQLFASIPLELVYVLQGVVMIFAVSRFALPRRSLRRAES
jgi:ABC-type uncharacterized transport system permease subunit